jgi:hypothetical protein
MARRQDPRLEGLLTVEEGDISFFAPEESEGVLAVTYTPGRGVWRALGFDGPRLGALRGTRERAEGKVLVVTPDAARIEALIARAPLVGTGPYAIVRHDHHHTHLVWSLSIPRSESPALTARGIPRRSTSLLVVKNPAKAASAEGPRFHPWILERFAGRRFMEATPPEVLDFVGAEIALIATADDVVSELGMPDQNVEPRDEVRALLHL